MEKLHTLEEKIEAQDIVLGRMEETMKTVLVRVERLETQGVSQTTQATFKGWMRETTEEVFQPIREIVTALQEGRHEDVEREMTNSSQSTITNGSSSSSSSSSSALTTASVTSSSNDDSMDKIVFTGCKYFTWGDENSKNKEMAINHRLPKNYGFANNLGLSDAYRMFYSPTSRNHNARRVKIPPMSSIQRPTFELNLPKERRTFSEIKAVVGVMDRLLDQGADGNGRALKIAFRSLQTRSSLNALADEGQKRFIAVLPSLPKTTKRHRPSSLKIKTANKYVPLIRRTVLGIEPSRGKKRKSSSSFFW